MNRQCNCQKKKMKMKMPYDLCSYSVYFLSQNVVSKTEKECYKIKQTKTNHLLNCMLYPPVFGSWTISKLFVDNPKGFKHMFPSFFNPSVILQYWKLEQYIKCNWVLLTCIINKKRNLSLRTLKNKKVLKKIINTVWKK